jgi:hypothetical protein
VIWRPRRSRFILSSRSELRHGGRRERRPAASLRPVSGGSLREADRADLYPMEPTALFARFANIPFAM